MVHGVLPWHALGPAVSLRSGAADNGQVFMTTNYLLLGGVNDIEKKMCIWNARFRVKSWILLYLSIMLMWSSVGRRSFDATHNNPSFAHFCFSSLTGNRQATTSSYRRFPYALQQNERTAEEEERDSKKTDTHSLIKPTLPSCNTQLNKDSFLVKSYLLPLPSAWARRVSESTLLQSVFVVHAHTR